jgi:uncharacterized protein
MTNLSPKDYNKIFGRFLMKSGRLLMETIIFKDKNNNCYLYSIYKRKLMYITSTIYLILDQYLNRKRSLELILDDIDIYTLDPKEKKKIISQINFLNDYGFIKPEREDIKLMKISPESLSKDVSRIEAISFEVTQKCNLQCTYCIYGEMYNNLENDHNKELSIDKAEILIDFLFNEYKSENFTSINKKITIGFYGGEPLLNFKLIKKIIEYSNKKKPKNIIIEYTMTTNCLLLNRHMDFLAENDFVLLLSLDGNFKSSTYRTPQKKWFDKIINNIHLLKTKYPDYFKKRVAFNAVLHNRNNIKNTISYIKNEFQITPYFSEISPVSLLDKKSYEFDNMRRVISSEIIQAKHEIKREDYIKVNPEIQFLNKFFNSITGIKIDYLGSLLNDSNISYILPTSTCSPFSYKLFIDSDGNLHPCEKIGYKYPLGHIDDKKGTVDFNYDQIADEYNTYYSRIFKKCEKCYNLHTCSTCLLEKNNKCSTVGKDEYTERLTYFVNRLIQEKDFFQTEELSYNQLAM